MKEQMSPEVIADLVKFLSPKVPSHLREQALSYIVGISACNEFCALFQANNFLLGRSLCKLAYGDIAAEAQILPALINVTATDANCANYVLSSTGLIKRCVKCCHNGGENSTNAAKLFSNLSLHFPDKVYNVLLETWEDVVADIVRRLDDTALHDDTDYLGYTLVNLTSLSTVRRAICEKHLRNILPLVDCSDRPKRRLIAIDILRNLCFETSCHSELLDKNDAFLSALLKPLADVNDNLDDDEIERLPLQLQYYESHRCEDPLILEKIIDALYQLCGSAIGLETLRTKGIYALLREFDRATSSSSVPSQSSKTKWNSALASEAESIDKDDTITDTGSLSRLQNDGREEEPESTVHNIQRMVPSAKATSITRGVKRIGESGNFVYIDGKNCSTLHAVIGLLIQD